MRSGHYNYNNNNNNNSKNTTSSNRTKAVHRANPEAVVPTTTTVMSSFTMPVAVSSSSTGSTNATTASPDITPSTSVGTSSTTTTTTTTTAANTSHSNTATAARLTVKSHPFIGAILSPKHAIELTPTLCLLVASALADLNMMSSSSSLLSSASSTPVVDVVGGVDHIRSSNSHVHGGGNHHQRLHSPTQSTHSPLPQHHHHMSHQQQQQQQPSHRGTGAMIVPYTVWITEAWRVLGWAEPSAALFWEMATMYDALLLSQREVVLYCYNNNNNNNHHHQQHHQHQGRHYLARTIPPILSCGSTGSVGSHGTTSERTPHGHKRGTAGASTSTPTPSRLPNSVASAKELPVWLVSTFLLLHCEEFALQRNLAGQPTAALSLLQQQEGVTLPSSQSPQLSVSSSISPLHRFGSHPQHQNPATTGKMDFSTLFQYPSSLSRTRLHSTWRNDHKHCTAYLLRHLRKVLLLCAISHSKEAQVACLHLSSIPTPNDVILSSLSSATMSTSSNSSKGKSGGGGGGGHKQYDADEIRRLHDDEHGNVGLSIRLSMEDLECLDFILQPPHGGMMDEPGVRIGELMWREVYNEPYPPPTARIPLGDVERVLREYLERELASDNSDIDDSIHAKEDCDIRKQQRSNKKKSVSSQRRNDEATDTSSTGSLADEATGAMSRLSLSDGKPMNSSSRERSDVDDIGNSCSKEIKYTRLRGTTVLLKPNPPEPPSTTASVASGEPSYYNSHSGGTMPGRLHDLVVSDCSDAHFYLLQPFEHVTIAACTGCTIVVGAVAGLLHIVDCEKTVITFAARRLLISNSCDVQAFLFTPSPPLLVGDNRTCQFAPYNTYYDGMREDLLVTGLAAPAMNDHSRSDNDALYPLLQCASNKWKQPIELSKLEVPQVPGSAVQSVGSAPLSPGADDRAMTTNMNDTTMQVPVLVPPSEYHILFVPIESESSRLRRLDMENGENTSGDGNSNNNNPNGTESQYCRLLAEVLQLSPFRLPLEYERSALLKAERMKNIQQTVQKNLSPEQQKRFEEELNRGFRDWLVSSGNLRQVLDLVHMENKEKIGSQ